MRYMTLVALLLLVGCAVEPVGPTREEWADAEAKDAFGPRPDPVEPILRTHWRTHLFDPDSVKGLSIGPPEHGWRATYHQDFRGFPVRDSLVFCWKVNAAFNARNKYGGYTGLQSHDYWIKAGRVIASE